MRKFINFIKNWNEIITLPIAVVLWFYSGDLLRYFDPTAGVYDLGILQAFLLGTVGILFAHALVWIILKLGANDVYQIFDNFTQQKDLTSWQKGLFSLLYWGFLLIAWAILVAGMS